MYESVSECVPSNACASAYGALCEYVCMRAIVSCMQTAYGHSLQQTAVNVEREILSLLHCRYARLTP